MRSDLPADPERWGRIEALLDEAFDRPPEERRAFLDQACAGDSELRAQMEALLTADEGAGSFLSTPSPEVTAELLAETSTEVAQSTLGELGPYRLIREIGSGGMGVVYEAVDIRLRRRVAIKLLPPEYSRDPAAEQRFLREARAASALDDPHICTVHDIGEHDGRLYIVMAYYEGETLKERLARGPLPVAEARQIAIQVARALARAHEAGIVHRDIKPANVMLTCREEVKVLDFGIAKVRGDTTLTRTGSSPGTPAYMSPEQARGEAVDGRADLWSLGVLLYEMLAGRRPFAGDHEPAVLSAVQSREPERLDRLRPEVPPELARTVAKALAKEPAGRHQSADKLLGELESRPRARVVPALRHWRRGRGFRISLLAGAIAASVLLALLVKEFFWHPSVPVLRVAVLRPIMTSDGKNPQTSYVASDVAEAVMSTLISLKGLQPIDPPQKEEESGSQAERSRRSEAKEVIVPLLDCKGDWCEVRLRRLREHGGVLMGTVGPFEIQGGIDNVQRLAEGVRAHMQELYSDYQFRPESQGGRVRPEDYSAYVKLERRVDAGEQLGARDLDQLDLLIQTSPDLIGAYRLAAEIARGLDDDNRALGYTSRAESLAPNDPRPLFSRFRAQIDASRFADAEETLKRLSAVAPGDIRVLRAQADLLEVQGELEKAHRLRLEIVHRRPLWPHIVDLATLEFRLGESASAHRRLDVLLAEQPTNQYVLIDLAALEVSSGDLNRAASLYEDLIRLQPTRHSFTNLGFVRYLLRDFAAAEKAERQALALEPQHSLTRFNLAIALQAEGYWPKARRIYHDLAKEFASDPPPDARMRLVQAQCLLRLGQVNEAARLAQEALKRAPEDFQVLHRSAQLYALLGERLKALDYIEQARRKGLRREWFTIPEFDSLRNDPEFKALLNSKVAHNPTS